MKGYLTIREASAPEHLNKSDPWIRAAIRHDKIKAEKIGHLFVIAEQEITRAKQENIIITRQEMFSGVGKGK